MATCTYIDILINTVIAIIMFGVGLSLTFHDFKNVLKSPKALITGLTIQLFILPIISFIIALPSSLSPGQKVGIVLVSICASGASSNLITHLVRGNIALAITMTTINSFITFLTVPFIISIAMLMFLGKETQVALPVGETLLQIFLVTIVPATVGIITRNMFTNFAVKIEKPLKIILPVLLCTVFVIKIFAGEKLGGSGITFLETLHILPYVLSLNILAMTAGFYLSKLVKLDFRNQFTIAIEVGLHNTALALLVAGTILKNPEMEMPAIVYSMFTFFTAIIFVYIVKGKNIFK